MKITFGDLAIGETFTVSPHKQPLIKRDPWYRANYPVSPGDSWIPMQQKRAVKRITLEHAKLLAGMT